jgi:hypothetical protein
MARKSASDACGISRAREKQKSQPAKVGFIVVRVFGVFAWRKTLTPISNHDCRLFSLAMRFEGLWWVVLGSNQ